MIAALIGLYRAKAMSYYATAGLCRGNNFSKAGEMNYAQNSTMLKIANAQQNYYQKLLDDNIKRTFNVLG